MSVRPVGLRERKKQRTKSDLEAAALRLFAARGYDDVTVDDIATEADVSARTFFRHFGSKDDVVMSFYRERLDRLRDRLAERPADEAPLVAVRRAIVTMTEEYELEKDDLLLRARLMASAPTLVARRLEVQQRWEEDIAAAVSSRLGATSEGDLRPALVGACAVAALRVASDAWLAAEGKPHLPALVDAALVLIAGGADADRWKSGEGLRAAPG